MPAVLKCIHQRFPIFLHFLFHCSPIEKWQARRKFPYKFVVQLIKLVLLTLQLCLFAYSQYNHVNYTWSNRATFSHLFLRGWDDASEVESYPPAKGPLALYIKSDFYETIDYALKSYANLSRTVGAYSYPNDMNEMAPMRLCIYHYEQGDIFGFNESYVFNPQIDLVCFNLTKNVTETGTKAYLTKLNMDINFSALVKATLDFSVKTVNFKAAGRIAPPDCYEFLIQILFDNSDHDGQMMLSLDAEPIRLHCQGNIEYITDTEIDTALRSMLNVFVILICIVSFSLCARALYRARLLQKQTDAFFRITFGHPLQGEDYWEFVNFWYIMIILNDVLLVLGSIIKDQIERKNFVADQWNICSVLLGVGNLLVWFGVLRYFSFFKTYNVVILTLKCAAPKILRFLMCAIMIYAGFMFCGWLVLGPYHIKFRSLATTSECLFSLINGDDMFATFSIMSTKSTMLWWFSRIYLYSFISLYIYVVLSLFIAVILDAYDTIKVRASNFELMFFFYCNLVSFLIYRNTTKMAFHKVTWSVSLAKCIPVTFRRGFSGPTTKSAKVYGKQWSISAVFAWTSGKRKMSDQRDTNHLYQPKQPDQLIFNKTNEKRKKIHIEIIHLYTGTPTLS